MSLEFEEAQEFVLEDGRKKYRATIVKFLGSGMRMAKITCQFPADAARKSQRLRSWIAEGEPVRVTKSKRAIYLIRTDADE